MNGDGISRKDFLNGVAFVAGAAMLGNAGRALAQDAGPDASTREFFLEQGITEADPRYYPPGLSGMRGSHPGSFEAGHMLRDGTRWDRPDAAADTGETYDLIVVGAGISGLAAAYFYRKKKPDARILILDNHDDFGGHAKRNEFTVDGRFLIGYGGTQAIEAIPQWGPISRGLLDELGIELKKFYDYFDHDYRKRWQLTDACFFDKETFGVDKLVPDQVGNFMSIEPQTPESLKRFLDATPMAPQAQADIMRLNYGTEDYLAGLSLEEKTKLLRHTSFQDFLVKYARVHPDVLKYYDGKLLGVRAVGIEAIDAMMCVRFVTPGAAKAMGLVQGGQGGGESEPYIFHFPDGNASIARMLVRKMIPDSAPGSTMEDIVTARMNYGALDRAGSATRLRLNSTVVRVRNTGSARQPNGVEMVYVRDGKAHRVKGAATVLACWNMIIPYMCPEMPQAQRDGLSYCVKVPLVYGTVAIRNWQSFHKLRAGTIYCPGMYFSEVYVDFPVSMGGYKHSESPDQPVLLHLVRTPRSPGLSMKDQYRAGRLDLFTTPFETFEENVRSQLERILGPGGFDPSRDIAGITINRWPHGYAYMASPLWDPDFPEGQKPHEVGRKPFGRITIANADAGGLAESFVSIDQAHRAIEEVLAMGA